MLSLKEMMMLMGIVTTDPSLPMEKPKLVGVSPIQATCLILSEPTENLAPISESV